MALTGHCYSIDCYINFKADNFAIFGPKEAFQKWPLLPFLLQHRTLQITHVNARCLLNVLHA